MSLAAHLLVPSHVCDYKHYTTVQCDTAVSHVPKVNESNHTHSIATLTQNEQEWGSHVYSPNPPPPFQIIIHKSANWGFSSFTVHCNHCGWINIPWIVHCSAMCNNHNKDVWPCYFSYHVTAILIFSLHASVFSLHNRYKDTSLCIVQCRQTLSLGIQQYPYALITLYCQAHFGRTAKCSVASNISTFW